MCSLRRRGWLRMQVVQYYGWLRRTSAIPRHSQCCSSERWCLPVWKKSRIYTIKNFDPGKMRRMKFDWAIISQVLRANANIIYTNTYIQTERQTHIYMHIQDYILHTCFTGSYLLIYYHTNTHLLIYLLTQISMPRIIFKYFPSFKSLT